jgi:hypothetical protein
MPRASVCAVLHNPSASKDPPIPLLTSRLLRSTAISDSDAATPRPPAMPARASLLGGLQAEEEATGSPDAAPASCFTGDGLPNSCSARSRGGAAAPAGILVRWLTCSMKDT